ASLATRTPPGRGSVQGRRNRGLKEQNPRELLHDSSSGPARRSSAKTVGLPPGTHVGIPHDCPSAGFRPDKRNSSSDIIAIISPVGRLRSMAQLIVRHLE